ncbi:MAG: CehA/McbA family metallohydrolase [Polyangiales bacterium]
MRQSPLRLFAPCVLALSLTCADETVGCLGSGDPACVPPPPCSGLVYTCQNSRVEVYRVTSADQRPPGLDAEAAVGDLVLENDYVRVVIDAIDHPHHLATSGGNILDIAPRGAGDHLNLIYTITGILPRDGVKYTSLELLTKTDLVAVIARGALDGDSRATVTTRYELRPCDRGVRVRTEVFNGGRTLATWFLGDAWWWGDRSLTPFIPTQGNGFVHPPLDLLEIDNSWRLTPWMAAQSHAAPAVSYATLSCTRASLEGVQDSTISAVGLPRTIVRPGDGQVFERMIFAAAGGGIAGAGALALEAHAKLFGGAVTTLTGRVTTTAGVPIGGDERLASVIAYEPSANAPDDPNAGTVWSQAVPSENGRFSLSVPSGKTLRVQLHRFGRATTTAMNTRATGANVDLGDLRVAPAGQVEIQVREDLTDAPLAAELVLVPIEGETSVSSVSGSLHGALSEPSCAPFLGPPHGSSPACNRVLAFDGGAAFAAPAGTYWVYGTAGPSTTLARQRITVREGETAQAELRLRRIDGLYPADSVSADMHVHGGRSFDTAFPDTDRVQSFVTAGVDVIIATDHDVVTSYQSAAADLGVADRVVIVPGVEATPLVPWLVPPGDTFPRVIGHWMFWPMRYDTTLPSNGMPWDERVEPGQLFERMRARMSAEGVMQLNHPTAHSKAGRDEGYFRMLGFNPTRPLPLGDDGTAMGMLWRRPGGPSAPRNIDWNVQEAMNGSEVVLNLTYRASWFAMLNRGLIRGGTANSDSHSLTTEQLGYPRNIVRAGFDRARFNADGFNRAVRQGRIVGTNGPYIEARTTDAQGNAVTPSVDSFRPAAGAMLDVEVRAAPWIPVTEVRFVVNGRVVRTVSGAEVTTPANPFGNEGIVRWRGRVALSDLLGGSDGWIVVEAGLPLPRAVDDEDADGLVDHIDGDGDGALDDINLARPRESDPRFHVDVISPGTLPYAFTNPFVVDVDGNGWRAPQ